MPDREDRDKKKEGKKRRKNRRGDNRRPFFFRLDFRGLEKMVNDMIRERFQGLNSKKAKRPQYLTPHIYGLSVHVGPDGVPRIRRFVDIQSGRYGRPELRRRRVPLVDVVENEDEIEVIAELPGVEKENISLRLIDGRDVFIDVNSLQRKDHNKIRLPSDVAGKLEVIYKNGVLKVVFKKVKEKRKGRKIEIECARALHITWILST